MSKNAATESCSTKPADMPSADLVVRFTSRPGQGVRNVGLCTCWPTSARRLLRQLYTTNVQPLATPEICCLANMPAVSSRKELDNEAVSKASLYSTSHKDYLEICKQHLGCPKGHCRWWKWVCSPMPKSVVAIGTLQHGIRHTCCTTIHCQLLLAHREVTAHLLNKWLQVRYTLYAPVRTD